ncbi:hypothetical protein Glove_40g109 [Diversispora epigaea]|uniref:Uncharacterized protein n=1 Tax=Diversispora epigaea TaxID=1348612 RepID=A0A397JHW6_9GLOM|nr:hypothetical protein Glove_40g109 [Diversispora epigaea]
MSSTIQNIDQLSTETETHLPTWQDIEKLIIDILRVGNFYNKDRNIGFMAYYKNHLDELHKSEDQEQYIIVRARQLLPNEEIYNTKIKAFSNSYYKNEPNIRQAILNYTCHPNSKSKCQNPKSQIPIPNPKSKLFLALQIIFGIPN